VVARFEQERQALALMDHPHIAKVLDAGATETGRPYFVMELVKGEPIVEYCDKNSLTIEERLELFSQVCRGAARTHEGNDPSRHQAEQRPRQDAGRDGRTRR
jgi:serine/threonine protein kinase